MLFKGLLFAFFSLQICKAQVAEAAASTTAPVQTPAYDQQFPDLEEGNFAADEAQGEDENLDDQFFLGKLFALLKGHLKRHHHPPVHHEPVHHEPVHEDPEHHD